MLKLNIKLTLGALKKRTFAEHLITLKFNNEEF